MTTLVALGDSLSCGEGVGLRLDPRLTWPALLAAAVPDGNGVLLAAPGARLRDVVQHQLPALAATGPDVVTLLIGMNDVAREGFSADRFAIDLCRVLDVVLDTGAQLLLARLPEPAAHVPLPGRLRQVVRQRTAQVNRAVDGCAGAGRRTAVVDLAAVPGLRLRGAWDVDRVHPSAAGHALVAQAAATTLRDHGLPIGEVATRPVPAGPALLREAWWFARSGAPWLARHVPSVVLPAARLSLHPAVSPR